MRCWFQNLYPHECEGRMDPVHLIPRQRIRQAGLKDYADDPRVIVPGCRHIHDRFDARNPFQKIELAYDEYPRSVHEFAHDFGWHWVDKRTGWIKTHDRQAA